MLFLRNYQSFYAKIDCIYGKNHLVFVLHRSIALRLSPLEWGLLFYLLKPSSTSCLISAAIA